MQQQPVTAKRVSEERHFQSMYESILEDLQRDHRISNSDIAKAVDEIISSFQTGHRFSDVDYSNYAHVCGYLFRYGAHGAGLARCMVLEALRQCEELRKSCLLEYTPEVETELKVVSLGGGPGNDALGFCSALAAAGFPGHQRLSVTVVDAVTRWETCVQLLTESLSTKGDYGDVSQMLLRDQVTIKFENAKLPANPQLHPRCYNAIRNADVILMTKLLSIVHWYDKDELIKDIRSNMKSAAFLLFIDSPFDPDFWYRLGFDVLFLSEAPDDDSRYRLVETRSGFGIDNDVRSKARIAVLFKDVRQQQREDVAH